MVYEVCEAGWGDLAEESSVEKERERLSTLSKCICEWIQAKRGMGQGVMYERPNMRDAVCEWIVLDRCIIENARI